MHSFTPVPITPVGKLTYLYQKFNFIVISKWSQSKGKADATRLTHSKREKSPSGLSTLFSGKIP